MHSETPSSCPSCGAPLAGSGVQGACFRCLGRLALGPAPAGPVDATEPLRGTRIGDYRLLEEIARGGMGVVYRARQESLRRLVAVKLLLRGDLADDEARRRFALEAEAAAALQHPGIVTVFEVGESAGEPFIAMELIDGPGLDQSLREGPWTAERAARCVHAVAEAVAYAHGRGVLHRDLKPSNILLDAGGRPHITDFGMARLAGSGASVTLAGRTFGSPNYMPPEQADPLRGPATAASDVFSLGAVLYHLLTGRPPFVADSLAGTLRQVLEGAPIPPRRLHPGIPPDLETICLKCLEKDPAHRYGGGQSMAEDLGRYLRGEPVEARPIGPVVRAWRWARRHPALASVSLGLVLALVGIAVTSSVAGVRVARLREEAEARASESRRHLIRSLVVTGNRYLAGADAQRALPWFLRAWELEPDAGERRVHEARLGMTMRHLPTLDRVWASGRRIEWLDLSPDGSRVVCADGGSRVHVWPTAAGDTNGFEIERGGPIHFAVFSPDGRTILTSGNRRSQLHDGVGRPLGESFPHDLRFANLPLRMFPAFSRDGARVLTAATNRVVMRDAATGGVLGRPVVMPAIVTAIAWFGDGPRCVVATADRAVSFLDLVTGQPVLPTLTASEAVRSLEWSDDGTKLAGLAGSQGIEVWDLAQPGREPLRLQHAPYTYQCRFIRGGQAILSTSYEGTARLWDARDGRLLHVFRHEGGVYRGLELGTNGLVVTAGWDDAAHVWDATTGRPAPYPRLNHGGAVLALDVDPARRRVITGGWDGIVRLQSLEEALTVTIPTRAVPLANARGRYVAVGAGTTVAVVFDPMDGRRRSPLLTHSRPVRAFGLSPATQSLATLTVDGQIAIWGLADGAKRLALREPAARDVELTPDGSRLLVLGTNQMVRWLDAVDGREQTATNALRTRVRSLAVSPDSRHVALLGVDGRVHIVAAADGRPVSGPFGAQNGAQSVTWSAEGGVVAVASGQPGYLENVDQSVRLWDVATGTDQGIQLGHRDDIRVVAFSGDGRWVGTGGDDYLAKVWDRRTGKEVSPPLRHGAWVMAMAFSPDGRMVATGTVDGVVRVWQVPGGEPVGPALTAGTELRWIGFDEAGESVVAGFGGRHARWDLALPLGLRDRLAGRIGLATGLQLDGEGGLRALTGSEVTNLWGQLQVIQVK